MKTNFIKKKFKKEPSQLQEGKIFDTISQNKNSNEEISSYQAERQDK